jgi:DNA-directed RNA polymerase specialized sigma24 family protein
MLSNSIGADDLQLAIAIKQGNQQSLGLLYDKYAPALSGIIIRIINNEKQAEKILNLTFVKIWNEVAAFNSCSSSLFSWLINLARQTAFEELKSEQEQNPQENNLVYEAHQKSAFDLVYYKGLTYNEVATVLQVPVAEVKASIKKTMYSMKEKVMV